MNYQLLHNKIIEKAKERNWNKQTSPVYVERHHIIPKCFGGSNSKENLVFLTAKEHYIIHLLLTKINTGHKKDQMIQAFHRMCHGNKEGFEFISARRFAILREDFSKVVSRQVTGLKHPMYGKNRSEETKTKMRLASLGEKNPMFGKKHSKETIEKMRTIRLGKKASEKSKQKLRDTWARRKKNQC